MNASGITHALNTPINKEDAPREYLFEEIEEEKAGQFSKKALAEKGHVSQGDIASLLELFENARTFGSLIKVPPKLATKLPEIERRLNDVLNHGDLTHAPAHVIKPLLKQALLLARQYDAVVANPPYMGGQYHIPIVKTFLKANFKGYGSNLFSAFIVRNYDLAIDNGYLGFMTPYVWMFISSYEPLRRFILSNAAITNFVKPSYTAFFDSAIVAITSFVLQKNNQNVRGNYFDLGYLGSAESQPIKLKEAIDDASSTMRFKASSDDFKRIPGHPIAYWISERMRQCFQDGTALGEFAEPRQGIATADNNRFLRRWHEVSHVRIGFHCPNRDAARQSRLKWFPYNKGGESRRWFGNSEWLVNWEDDGKEIQNFTDSTGYLRSRPQSLEYMFRPALTWSFISSSFFAVRCSDPGFLFDVAGSSAFPPDEWRKCIAGFLCSSIAFRMMNVLNPTVNFQVGNVGALPVLQSHLLARKAAIEAVVQEAVQLARSDWDSFETSWDFQALPVLRDRATDAPQLPSRTLAQSQAAAEAECLARFARMKQLEEQNNRLFIAAYGLQDEISPEVPDEQITLYRPDKQEDIKRLLSYAIGCVMGRYSLDKPGLIYAHTGNQGFDPSQYKTFLADNDGIVPLLETDWGIRNEATNRIMEFIGVAWPKEQLEENLKFIADSLGPNNGEQPRDTIRRYLATGFYKHHLPMYKKRPIYWLFSSGKQRAFQCLVYLHCYHEGTLARMRTEYVIPLQGQIAARIEQLEGDKAQAASTSHRRKLQKEQDDLKKQRAELLIFEEKLKHAADQKISLDLDDGVKVNYGKFGDLLAEAKAITGGKDDE